MGGRGPDLDDSQRVNTVARLAGVRREDLVFAAGVTVGIKGLVFDVWETINKAKGVRKASPEVTQVGLSREDFLAGMAKFQESMAPKTRVVFEHVDMEGKFKADGLATHFPSGSWPDAKAVRFSRRMRDAVSG